MDVKTETQIKISILKIFKEIKKFLEIARAGELLQGNLKTPAQSLFALKYSDQVEQKIYEVILSFLSDSERTCPGTFIPCVERMISLHEGTPTDLGMGKPKSRLLNKSDLVSAIGDHVPNVSLQSVLLEALELTGFKGRISVEQSNGSIWSIERVHGHKFQTLPGFKINRKFSDSRVVLVDGMIESVGEIHHVLSQACESGDSVILFARSFHPDVLNTLRINFDQSRCAVIPVNVPFDLSGMNTLCDLAVICGSDVVSSLKGDLISSIKLSDCPRVESLSVGPHGVEIQTSKNVRNLQAHIQDLVRRRSESNVDDVKGLLDDRLKTLSSSQTIIRVPETMDVCVIKQQIDVILRMIRAMMDHGVVDWKGTIVPGSFPWTVEHYAKRCVDLLNDLGAVVIS